VDTEDHAIHKQKMLLGLQSIINLMPITTEVGAVSLLDMAMRGICVMRGDGDITEDEAEEMRANTVRAFQVTHPSLNAALKVDLSILNDVIVQVLKNPRPDNELVQLARGAMNEFRLRGLETIQ